MMKFLRTTQHYDSLYNGGKNGTLVEEDETSFNDDDYCFSDDEEQKQTSFKLQDLYYDQDMNEKRGMNQQQKHLAARPSGALEELFAPTTPAKTSRQNRPKRSSTSSRASTDGNESQKNQLSSSSNSCTSKTSSQLSRGSRLSSSFISEVNEEDYETDSDYEGLEFASDSYEASSLNRKSLIEKALNSAIGGEEKITRTPLKRTSSKKRLMNASPLSSQQGGKQEDSERKNRRSKKGTIDPMSISLHCMRKEALPPRRKPRSSSLSGPRQRRASDKTDSMVDSDIDNGQKPKRSSSSISTRRFVSFNDSTSTDLESAMGRKALPTRRKSRSSSLAGPRQRRASDKSDSMVDSDEDKRQKLKRSTSLTSSRRFVSLNDSTSTNLESAVGREDSLSRRSRSSSLAGRRQRRASEKTDFMVGSDIGKGQKPKRSTSLTSSRRFVSLNDSNKSTTNERRRSLSKQKRFKKNKNFDSESGDDDKRQRSASASRRKKSGLDSSSHKRSSSLTTRGKKVQGNNSSAGICDAHQSQTKQRRVPIKKSSSFMEGGVKKSESSLSLSARSAHARVTKGNRKSTPDDIMPSPAISKPDDREPIKKPFNDYERVEAAQWSESATSLSSSSSNGKPSRKSSKRRSFKKASNTRSKSPFRPSDSLHVRSEEFTSPTSLSSSSKHGRSRRFEKVFRDF